MTSTISTSTFTSVTLTPSDNPVTITPSGYIDATIGLQGATGTSFTVTNQGTVKGTTRYGITFGQGGTVTNLSGGLVSGTGPFSAIRMGAGAATPGLVVNYGSIIGGGPASYAVYLATVGTVTNASTGLLQGASGVRIENANASVKNLGQITGTYATAGYGIYLRDSGTVLNGQNGPSTATIEGYTGIAFKSTPISLPGTLYNYGTILGTGTETSAVGVQGGGVLINGGGGATGALIQGGRYGVYFSLPETIANYATIEATGGIAGDAGVSLNDGPAILNNAGPSALISGYVGVNVGYGTVINSGTIVSTQGASGVAVNFVGGSNLLVVDPGAVFVGTVAGSTNNSNTIELSGTVSSTITNLGTSFTNFGTVLVGPNARWTMAGPSSIIDNSAIGAVTIGAGANLMVSGPLSTGDAFALNGGTLDIAGTVAATSSFNLSGGTSDDLELDSVTGAGFSNAITGFGAHDTIDLTGVTFATGGIVTGGGGTLFVPLQNGGTFAFSSFSTLGTPSFQVSAHTLADTACFASGTRIRTISGDVAVEALRVGDTVVLADGRTSPVIWIGHRAVNCRQHPNPDTVSPVRVAAGALGPGVPERDLVLSPGHALYLNGVLIPVRLLINGASITRLQTSRVTYYHVELPRHGLLLAEGVATESYLDTGDRREFDGGRVTAMFPDFTARTWEMEGCAPLVLIGPALDLARAEIDARADRLTVQASKETVALSPRM